MYPNEYFNLLEYVNVFEKLKNTLESDINKLLYTNLLINNHNNNKIQNECIEFIYKNDNTLNKCMLGKYCCELKINLNNKSIPDIRFIIFDKQNKLFENNQIQKLFPNLFNQIIFWWQKHIINLEYIKILSELRERIIEIKKYILNNFTPDDLATNLYRYYFINIDKFINIDDSNAYKTFYDWICIKYNLDSNNTNFKLDYLQNYFENNMYLKPDFKVSFNKDNNSIIKFFNSENILEIKLNSQIKNNFYKPKYTIEIIDLNTGNKILKPTYNQFNLDRKLEKYYTNLIEYIIEFINKTKNSI